MKTLTIEEALEYPERVRELAEKQGSVEINGENGFKATVYKSVQSPCPCHGWPPQSQLTMIETLNPWLSPENLPFRTPILVKHVGIYGAEEHPVVYMGFCTMEDGLNVLLLSHPTKPSAILKGDEIQKIIGWKALPQ